MTQKEANEEFEMNTYQRDSYDQQIVLKTVNFFRLLTAIVILLTKEFQLQHPKHEAFTGEQKMRFEADFKDELYNYKENVSRRFQEMLSAIRFLESELRVEKEMRINRTAVDTIAKSETQNEKNRSEWRVNTSLTEKSEFVSNILLEMLPCKQIHRTTNITINVTISYTNSMNCIYVIKGNGKRIEYWSNHFKTEENYDTLYVIDGNNVAKYHGDTNALLTRKISTSAVLLVYFFSDQSTYFSPIVIFFNQVP
ncbi:hypothetical protein B4U80_13713 [Leptotrombidium deliense]|uniref:CUB domain-containing protein n=1 Tax=Leptotrombidium deliense TaxID=299467 RepID=A0A443SJ37_9ACAR|nr:hypothetical protein B4U80_13713 [Leptotrombidium deliense]